MIIQLSITLIMPLAICIAFCHWLCTSFAIGVWIYIPGFFFGLGSSFMSAWKFYQTVIRRQKKKDGEKKKTAAFNDHV